MRSRPIIPLVMAAFAGVFHASACGDSTEPPDPPRPTTVTVSPATAELTALAATVQLMAEVLNQYGQVMAGAPVTWTSSGAGVATVDASGLVAAADNGTATITATAGDASGNAIVTVAQTVSTVAVFPSADTVVERDTLRLFAEARDANGHAVMGAEFTWASSDTLVALVSDSGLVTGAAPGEVEVAATSSEVTGRTVLVVEAPMPTTVTVAPDSLELPAIGDTVRLVAGVRDQIGRVMAGEAVAWASEDTLVATVDSAGLVMAIGNGRVTIIARAGTASGSAAASVMQQARSVTVSPSSVNIHLGDTARLVPEAFDENGYAVAGAEFTWSSSDTSVAVADSSGLVRAVTVGVATITATANGAQGTTEVTVTNPDRDLLMVFYQATGGRNWVKHDNWLTEAPLDEWHGVYTDSVGRVSTLSLHGNNLTGTIPPELGDLTSLRQLRLTDGGLTGAIPRELANLTELTSLQLYSNHLTGSIPQEFGNLTSLRSLLLSYNLLTGPIPQSFLRLDSLGLSFGIRGNAGLCLPATTEFLAWFRGAADEYCSEADRAALNRLYEVAGGSAWSNASGWLRGVVLADWYGVQTDSVGWVQSLDLRNNGLTGHLPSDVGHLASLTKLRINGNALSGSLPMSLLRRLSLDTLHYADTDLCAPSDEDFQAWLSTVQSHVGTGNLCAPQSDRDILIKLYDATNGIRWHNQYNWLTNAPIEDWYGVETDTLGTVARLELLWNGLHGTIPSELGKLIGLRELRLGSYLSGRIPPELGNLENLEVLTLGGRYLGPIPPDLGNLAKLSSLTITGAMGRIPPELGDLVGLLHLSVVGEDPYPRRTSPIPAELGSLAKLRSLTLNGMGLRGQIPTILSTLDSLSHLSLESNRLTGPIPPEIGRLAKLTELSLDDNYLVGPIPPEIGGLSRLLELSLAKNRLSGPLPSELGGLRLWWLDLAENRLSGPVPPELGNATFLYDVRLNGNAELSGPLPSSVTNLTYVRYLSAQETELCAPNDPEFGAWLDRMYWVRLRNCGVGSVSLVQAIQSQDTKVPLVAGDDAQLRVFVTASRANTEPIPPVRATFYQGGAELHVVEIPGKQGPIPTNVREGDLQASVNARIPGTAVQPGVELVVEVDPDGTADSTLGIARRIPETGRLGIDVRAMPTFNLTVIPMLYDEHPDSSLIDAAEAMAADPQANPQLEPTRSLLPVGGLNVTAHDPVWVSTGSQTSLLLLVEGIRVMEGSEGYYTGIASTFGGIAYLGGRSSVSTGNPVIMAHEFGHNMSLGHAPCHVEGDPLYPYAGGVIGAWGYDSQGDTLISPQVPDLMGYCSPNWVSDYHFSKALRHRLEDESPHRLQPTRVLLLWGGRDGEGNLYLEPAFVLDAPPVLPDSTGDHALAGHSAEGRVLFAMRFSMPETADAEGTSGFVFALPVQPGWEGTLTRVTLAGPGGTTTLDLDTDRPTGILRDPRTGSVRGILPGQPSEFAVQAGFEVLFSRGIPDRAAWGRREE